MFEVMNRYDMLEALQADVNAWPQRVKEAGVKKKDGTAYVPMPRNVAVLRTPDDPEATLAAMIEAWQGAAADSVGSAGWDRVIEQAGPELTWEWLMVDESKPYASLFPAEIRDVVRQALGLRGPDPTEVDVEAVVRPRFHGQRRTAAERRAIENRAVEVVAERLEAERWSVEDVGMTRSYDLHCTDENGRHLYVEVKGTTGPLSAVTLTANEVQIAREQHPQTALYVVSGIILHGNANEPTATGGTVDEIRPWLPDEARLQAKTFRYRLP